MNNPFKINQNKKINNFSNFNQKQAENDDNI